MTKESQVEHLSDELDRLIERFRLEYDLAYSDVLGVLQFKVYTLCKEAVENFKRK